jgi:hypothetical protein
MDEAHARHAKLTPKAKNPKKGHKRTRLIHRGRGERGYSVLMDKEMKVLKVLIPLSLHKELKLEAVERETTMGALVVAALKRRTRAEPSKRAEPPPARGGPALSPVSPTKGPDKGGPGVGAVPDQPATPAGTRLSFPPRKGISLADARNRRR